jgi:predicted Zn-dependent protease
MVLLFSATAGAAAQDMGEAYRHYRNGDFDRAAEIVEDLVDRGRASPSDMAFLGTCYLNTGNLEKAEEVIGAAAMLAPDAYPVMLARGNLALARSSYGEAEEIFRKARERFSGRREAQEGAALAAYGRAAELIEAGEYEEALPPLRRAVAAQPENERLLAALIAVLRKTDRKKELLEVYGQYIGLHPYSADALAGRGLLLYEMGRTRRALEDLRKAADLDTSEPEAYYVLALRSMERGEPEEARSMLHETIGKAVQLYSMYRIQAAQAMEGSGANAGGGSNSAGGGGRRRSRGRRPAEEAEGALGERPAAAAAPARGSAAPVRDLYGPDAASGRPAAPCRLVPERGGHPGHAGP